MCLNEDSCKSNRKVGGRTLQVLILDKDENWFWFLKSDLEKQKEDASAKWLFWETIIFGQLGTIFRKIDNMHIILGI